MNSMMGYDNFSLYLYLIETTLNFLVYVEPVSSCLSVSTR